MTNYYLDQLRRDAVPLRRSLTRHSVYSHIHSIEDLRIFMESHIFAVWDFMSLLKALQRELTCINVPWFPSQYRTSRRLINEIVLAEESDVDEQQRCVSHFELYLSAMSECEADTFGVNHFLSLLESDVSLSDALHSCGAAPHAKQFVETTYRFLSSGQPHVIAAAFTFGREEVIPDMFRAFVTDLNERFPDRLAQFLY